MPIKEWFPYNFASFVSSYPPFYYYDICMYSTKRQAAFHHQLDYNIDDARSTTRTRTTLHPQRGKLKSWIVRWEGTKAVSLPDQFCPINRSSYHFMTSNLSYDIPSSIRFARTTSENSESQRSGQDHQVVRAKGIDSGLRRVCQAKRRVAFHPQLITRETRGMVRWGKVYRNLQMQGGGSLCKTCPPVFGRRYI
jgi:hypothetical protein